MNIIEYENYHEQFPPAESGFPYLTYPCSIPPGETAHDSFRTR